ncbi:hypothetical protein PT282_01600 [Bifidobacterium sp. ESL0763]|uniref:hypothetical protein n=1 Tax=Bifidobacterium sp. ESL0763 TaxID=2983227 RepID=UPI0023F69358|nr:hypothetical protein [Bifidobacterium sp. ESL0763]MDF7663376.1 hypothetical protein [Bifidobacterium sp. ESL0763]
MTTIGRRLSAFRRMSADTASKSSVSGRFLCFSTQGQQTSRQKAAFQADFSAFQRKASRRRVKKQDSGAITLLFNAWVVADALKSSISGPFR